ncbi:HAD family hydrolase [Halorientalis salina]|uniref:HAD family hydrolase n=1 Tax=Halorientalis salina TaxID=2932266 RepID=UPI0010AB857C|nr:HAD family hydrolase [Halorientalis salina]
MAPAPVAVVFDLDDTLAVTDRTRQTLLDEATSHAGTDRIARAEYLQAHGAVEATETRAPIFERLLDDDSDATATDLATAYRERIEDALRPVPGAADLIGDLRRTYRVGLLTDGPVVAQHGKLERLGWEDLFDAVVVTGTLAAGKPDRRAFEAVCDALDVRPDGAVYVGDRPEVDIAGAADAGFRTVQVLTPENPDSRPEADAVIDRGELVARLPDLLQAL